MQTCANTSRRLPDAGVSDCRPGTRRQVRWPRRSSAWRPMDDSLSSWLALREAADTAARSVPLTEAIADVLNVRLKADATSSTGVASSSTGLASSAGPVRVLDLATGTGSNIRYLAPRLSRPQQWLVIDR